MSNLAASLDAALVATGFAPSERVRRSILNDLDLMYRQQIGRDPTPFEIGRAIGVFKATGHFEIHDIPK